MVREAFLTLVFALVLVSLRTLADIDPRNGEDAILPPAAVSSADTARTMAEVWADEPAPVRQAIAASM
ncbi:MAG: hypothetical protein H7Z10_07425 [Gemmatimonadaceae bacterium]|nr:hypothetical protein [Acetobacteraceae bacterium]